ncbi:MAG: hypothetical protein KF856_00215 [Cyclobacteriaceae bacterium]|nr:hypothetical protein [Cyclobacteriaceae bacterium]
MKNTLALLFFITISTLATAQTLKDEWVTCNSQGCQLLDPYYNDGVTITWDGECINQKANGYGKAIKYQNGEYESTYEGEYKNGIRDGKGKFSHKDGSVKEGHFVNGQLTGQGIMYDTAGYDYTGNFVNYRMHGYGLLNYPNGASLEGFFVSDRLYTGKMIDQYGRVYYLQKFERTEKIADKTSTYTPAIGSPVKEYFNKHWERCNRTEATFYRLITYAAPNTPSGIIKNYYITGELQSQFFAAYVSYDDEGKNFYRDEVTTYFKNGKIQQKKFYLNGRLSGKQLSYYDNNQIAMEANYTYGVLHGEVKEWYKSGEIKSVSVYEVGTLKTSN